MLPLTMLASTKVASLLTTNSALTNAITLISNSTGISVPQIDSAQICLSSASPDLADTVNQFTYPRVCLYSGGLKNSHTEKFRSLSGSLMVIAEIWSSGNFVRDTDSWIHFYVDAFTTLIQTSIGDWGDGIFFPGSFEVQFQSPKRGGIGFTQMAKIICHFNVSRK